MVDSNGKAEEFGSIHFNRERVVDLEAANKVFSPSQVLEFDSKIVDDESKGDAIGDMPEEADCASLMITVRSKACDEDILSDLTGMR